MLVLLIARLTTQNAGNEALSKILIRFAISLYPKAVVNAVDRYPRSFERYTLAGLGPEPEKRFDEIATWLIERGEKEPFVPMEPATEQQVKLDARGHELGGILRSIKRRVSLRGRLAALGLIERADTWRAVHACMGSDLVIWSPAGEVEPHLRSVDHVMRLLLMLRITQLSLGATVVLNHSLEPASEQIARLIAHVYRNADIVGVRDARSARVAEKMGIDSGKIVVAPDLAFLTSRYDGPAKRKVVGNAIGVAINGRVASKNLEDWRDIAGGLRALGRPLIFVSNAMNHDREFLQALRDLVGSGTVYDGQPGYLELRKIYGQCAVVLSSRLHASIFALAEGVPVVSIEPSDFKLTAIFEQMDYPIATIDPRSSTWAKQALNNLSHCLQNNSLRDISRTKVSDQAEKIEKSLARLHDVKIGAL